MTQVITAAMVGADVATQAELDVVGAAAAAAALKQAGDTVQAVNQQTGAVATGTTVMPFDDTIPQITEGNEYLTATITPTGATNILLIEVIAYISNSTGGANVAALFQDATANALAGAAISQFGAAGAILPVVMRHRMVAGTVAATTFRFRAGPSGAGTLTLNGVAAGRILGGVLLSSMRVTEIKA